MTLTVINSRQLGLKIIMWSIIYFIHVNRFSRKSSSSLEAFFLFGSLSEFALCDGLFFLSLKIIHRKGSNSIYSQPLMYCLL